MPRIPSRQELPKRPNHRTRALVLAGGLVLAGALAVWLQTGRKVLPRAGSGVARGIVLAPVLEAEAKVFAAYAGSTSCRDCHAAAYELWAKSNHGLAERAVDDGLDRTAFELVRTFAHGTQTTEVGTRSTNRVVSTLGLASNRGPWRVERVIGHDPLRQFLVGATGGRLQTLEASYDPHRNEWFNVYGNEDRQPGEWGHWTGRGMTWNSQCAGCHNTRLRKNYDGATDSYRTVMAERSVGCEACHGPLKAHVDWRRRYPDSKATDPTLPKYSAAQVLDTCGSCHARRGELTGDFKPGDAFTDHFRLTLVDDNETYYPDGQIREEDYEYGSFLGSRMHAAGVRCLDCHEPHAAKTRLPGNALCLRCHNGSFPRSPVINPATHTFHQPESTGSLCVNCHMPQTTYMQRHPRHDHGFTIPDPVLTKQLGVPNACNRCHTDHDVEWTLAAVEKWYGQRMERRTRARALTIAGVRRGDESARSTLLALLAGDEMPYWKAVAAGLLEHWLGEPEVIAALASQLGHTNALVRVAAVRSLTPLAGDGRLQIAPTLTRFLADSDRGVRLAAAWALSNRLPLDSPVGGELQHQLDLNADQPAGQMQKAAWQAGHENMPQAVEHLITAVKWDPNSAPIRHELAVLFSMMGRGQDALAQLQIAVQLEPKVAEYHYKLALAWNELADLGQTVSELEEAVRLDPRHSRAWYNLGLARDQRGDASGAVEAVLRAESANPRDAGLPYARATILARLGRIEEARAAAGRALELQPDSAEAKALVRSLGR